MNTLTQPAWCRRILWLAPLIYPFALMLDTWAASVVQFATSIYSVPESSPQAILRVSRTNDLGTAVSVDFATADGTAVAAADYVALRGTLEFAGGVASRTFAIPILNDGAVEPTETFQVLLLHPTGGAVLGSRPTTEVLIQNNDTPVGFEFPSYQAREDEPSVVIGITRGDDGDQTVTVDYLTIGSTAAASSDYIEVAGTLSFSPGEKLKLVEIPILNDAKREGNEILQLMLTNVVGSTLSTARTVPITLKDNDPGVQFAVPTYWVHEHEGELRIQVQRGSDTVSEAFTVDYATQDASAVAGLDYTATSGTLRFDQGEMTRTFTVSVANDELLEPDEMFRVLLRNPGHGALLGLFTTLTVRLCDGTGSTAHAFADTQRLADGSILLGLTGGVSKRFIDFFDLYPLEFSADLAGWQTLPLLERTNNSTAKLTVSDPGAAGARFWRLPTRQFITPYPQPTGPYSVGTMSYLLTDSSRRNRYNLSGNGSFAVSVWYPADQRAGLLPQRWLPEPMARDASPSGLWMAYGSGVWLDRLPYLFTHSFSNAPFATGIHQCPVVLFSNGWRGSRELATVRAEELASHGYIVVAPDHFDAANTMWPNGFYHSSLENKEMSLRGTQDRVRDLVFLLDYLEVWQVSDGVLAGRFDMGRVGVMGLSYGGASATDFARSEARSRAAVLLDPGGGGAGGEFTKPSLTVLSTEWNDTVAFSSAKTNAWLVRISDTDHGSMGFYLTFSEKSPVSNREAARTINTYALSFFNKFLLGRDDHLLDDPLDPQKFPRVSDFRKK